MQYKYRIKNISEKKNMCLWKQRTSMLNKDLDEVHYDANRLDI